MQNVVFIKKLNLTFIVCDHLLLRSLLIIMWHPLKKSRLLNLKKNTVKKRDISLLNLTLS